LFEGCEVPPFEHFVPASNIGVSVFDPAPHQGQSSSETRPHLSVCCPYEQRISDAAFGKGEGAA
jgi:hypothetical protein